MRSREEPSSTVAKPGRNQPLTWSQLASLTLSGTVSGNNVTGTGLLALVDTVAATQSGLTSRRQYQSYRGERPRFTHSAGNASTGVHTSPYRIVSFAAHRPFGPGLNAIGFSYLVRSMTLP
jgi:hypothetical protein